jgi:tetratricopeptide (TPR) repeat protein
MNRVLNLVQQRAEPQARSFPASARRRLLIATAVVVPLFAAPALVRILVQRQLLVDKLQRSEEQCRRADENLLLAMRTLGDRIDHLGLETELLPQEELAFYKAIYDQAASEPAERFAISTARKRAGLLYLKLHQPDEARLCFALAIHMLEALAVEKPEPEQASLYRRTLAETYTDDAAYLAAIGDTAAAEARYDAASALLSKLLDKWPGADELLADQARIWHARGAMFARLHRYPEAEADLQRALAIRAARSCVQRDSNLWFGSPGCELTATMLQLSDLYRDIHRPDEAIAVIDQAIAAYTQLHRYHSDLHYQADCAEVWKKLADACFLAGETPASQSSSLSAEQFQQTRQRHFDPVGPIVQFVGQFVDGLF